MNFAQTIADPENQHLMPTSFSTKPKGNNDLVLCEYKKELCFILTSILMDHMGYTTKNMSLPLSHQNQHMQISLSHRMGSNEFPYCTRINSYARAYTNYACTLSALIYSEGIYHSGFLWREGIKVLVKVLRY